jgi:FkbM family methyltransferase
VDGHDSGTSLKQFLNRWYEPAVSAVFLDNIQSSETVIDVGANKGYFSLLALPHLDKNASMVSFEPLPDNVRDLHATRAINNYNNWLIREVALSSTCGEVRFHAGNAEQSGWGQVDSNGELRVQRTTLDLELEELGIDAVGLIKIDIEGHELEAIHGMTRTLSRRRVKCLMVEIHPERLDAADFCLWIEQMNNWGYEGFRINERAVPVKICCRLLDAGQHEEVSRQVLVPLDSAQLPTERIYVVWKRN